LCLFYRGVSFSRLTDYRYDRDDLALSFYQSLYNILLPIWIRN
jgi:hypothetical protein